MTQTDSYFSQTQPIRALEARFLREASRGRGGPLPRTTDLFRYAFSVAKLERLRTGTRDVDLFEEVAPFRHWLAEQLEYFIDLDRKQAIPWNDVTAFGGSVVSRLTEVRNAILARHSGRFDEDRLEAELRQRRLVLVLGGGGGSGYAHLGLFAVLSELGVSPSLIVGSSMGALVGLFRAAMREYDPMTTALALPRPSEFGRVFAPYRGFSRFGFPGTLEIKARSVGREIFANLLGTEIPQISELPIPFRALGTGLRTGIGLAISEVERDIERARTALSPFALRRRVALFSGIVRTMIARPRFLSEVVFGGPGLRDFNAVDAVGFSCAVPGILHYDIYAREDDTIHQLQNLFAERQIFRMTDGGVANNVASRVAWDAVHAGDIRTRNTFILAADAFAPLVNRNALFIPAQQLARTNVSANRAYSDHHITYQRPPSPAKVLQSFEGLQEIIARVRVELEPQRPLLSLALSPLPRWDVLRDDFLAAQR